MEYIQIGRSEFLTPFFITKFGISEVIPFRVYQTVRPTLGQRVILVPPKDQILNINKDSLKFDVPEIIVVSSIAVSVTSFASKKFQKYKKYKIDLESTVENSGDIKFIRFGMFVGLKNIRSVLVFILACLLSIFAPKNRLYIYTTEKDLKKINFNSSGISNCFGIIKGKGLLKIKSFKLKKVIIKLFVKVNIQ